MKTPKAATEPSPLARFTVLDLTRVRSGPTCVRQLADWGANVIKIELPEHLDAPEGGGGPRHGSDFQNLHRNKRGLALDLKSKKGVAVFKRLAAKADVIVENYRPDVKTRLGIDYATMAALNPRIVYASISGFGQTGPYAKRPGFDQIAQGMGGLMSVTGEPGRGPMRVGIPVADLTAGLFAALGILTALLEREQSGHGQAVETSLLAAQIFMLDFQAARWLTEKQVPGQAGNDHPTSIPTGVFKTRDGHINIATTGSRMWAQLCETIGQPALIEDKRFATGALRSKNRAACNAEIAKRLAAKTSAEWVELFNRAGVPAGPIYTIDQTFADPQVAHLGLARQVETGDERGTLGLVAQPFSLSRTPSAIVAAPPTRGQHADQVLAEFGFTKREIAALRKAKVI